MRLSRALALGAAMLVAVAACSSGGGSSPSAAPTQAPAESPAPAQSTAPETTAPTEAPAVKPEVRIGSDAFYESQLVAEMFAQEQCKVVMVDINEEQLKAHCERLNATYVVADLSKRADCKNVVDQTVLRHNTVDVLVNVAGIQTVSPIEDFPEDKWDFMINLMLTSPFLLTRYSWPYMKENKWGRVVNLNSIHGLVASEFKSAYVSAKHGLAGLTKTAALEGGPLGITVNSVCPSYVMTPLVQKQIAAQAINHGISEEEENEGDQDRA